MAKKEGLLGKWLAKKKGNKESIAVNNIKEFPLAYNQQSLYFFCQLDPDNPFYNNLDVYRLQGPIHVPVLINSFEKLIERHEAFRTKFVSKHGKLLQVIEPTGKLEVKQHDLRNTEKNQEVQLEELLISKDSRKAFDLNKGNLLRLSVVRISDEHCVIGMISHHIVLDKWSITQLRHEVADIYLKQINGENISHPDFNTSFGAYAKEQVEKTTDAKMLSYWKNKLAGADEIIDLPFDFKRPIKLSYNGKLIQHNISKELGNKIISLCKELSITPFVLFIATYKVLLSKYGKNKVVNVGVPFTNKESSELEKIAGFFDETLVLSSKMEQTDFISFIKNVSNTVYEAFDNKQVPLEILAKELKPERIANVNPLFQTMFIYQKTPSAPNFGQNIEYSNELIEMRSSKFDLTLFLEENENGFATSFEYATDLFEESTIKALADAFQNLLHNLINNPNRNLDEVSILDDKSYQEMVIDWNDTSFDLDFATSIPSIIDQKTIEFPLKTALTDTEKSIDYRTLGKLSDDIANNLKENGISNGDIVGLYFGRTIDMVVSILGVLKSGAAYLPLDPAYPENRINYMLADSKVKLLIVEDKRAGDMEQQAILFKKFGEVSIESNKELKIEVNSSDLAYVIYTSGSTGNPKGVGITHLNLLNSTLARNSFYEDKPGNFLLFSSFSFDSSIAGIFWTLTSGGNLVLTEERVEQDVDKLLNIFNKNAITHTLLLPTLYQQILLNKGDQVLSSLQCIMVAGEACPVKLPGIHFKTLPHARLFNEYGPTEASVWSIAFEIVSGNYHEIPIGKPIGNTQVYILDEYMNPVPKGVAGELYIGGLNVTKGYLYQDKATNEKFVANPFQKTDEKLYRTGDLGKYQTDGNILFLGRADGQVKVRGYRIELSEIERVVSGVEGVKDATILISQKEVENIELEMIIDELKNLPKDQAEEILGSIEQLSDNEVNYFLNIQ